MMMDRRETARLMLPLFFSFAAHILERHLHQVIGTIEQVLARRRVRLSKTAKSQAKRP